MPADDDGQTQLEIGHVLFIDIVGYSKLLTSQQRERVEQLNQVVRSTDQFRSANAAGKLVRLTTGDGMALAFFTSPDAPARCALQIAEQLRTRADLPLRMGIHSGPVSGVTDVNDRSNIAGAGINMAQRVMDCGDAGHILLSKRIADDLGQDGWWHPQLHDLGECEVKHGVKVQIVSLWNDTLGNSQTPSKLNAQKQQSRRRQWAVLGGAAALLVIGIGSFLLWRNAEKPASLSHRSVAVLPFESLSANEDNAIFAGGVHREILLDLAKVSDLKVISRTSVMQYAAGATRNLKQIARELGVSHIVEGSVQRDRDKVRVTAQLIDAATDTPIWAEAYDRELADVFAIQNEIAQKITDQLGAKLSSQERIALTFKPTQNIEAFEAYIKARTLMDTHPESFDYHVNFKAAVQLLETAVTRDPQFALAYCALAEANTHLFRDGERRPDMIPQAQAALEKARKIAPETGEVQYVQALIYYYGENNFGRALTTLEAAARSLPNDADIFVLRGWLERRLGRWEEALRHFKQAIELNPKELAYGHAAGAAFALRRNAEAERIIDAGIAARPPEVDTYRAWKGMIALQTGDFDAARIQLKQISKKDNLAFVSLAFFIPYSERKFGEAAEVVNRIPIEKVSGFLGAEFQARLAMAGLSIESRRAVLIAALARSGEDIAKSQDDYNALTTNAFLNLALGNKVEAIRVAKRAVDLYPVSRDAFIAPNALRVLAMIYSWTGEADPAFKTLFEWVKLPDHIWIPAGSARGFLEFDPAWDNLRNDPRFNELLVQAAKPLR